MEVEELDPGPYVPLSPEEVAEWVNGTPDDLEEEFREWSRWGTTAMRRTRIAAHLSLRLDDQPPARGRAARR